MHALNEHAKLTLKSRRFFHKGGEKQIEILGRRMHCARSIRVRRCAQPKNDSAGDKYGGVGQ